MPTISAHRLSSSAECKSALRLHLFFFSALPGPSFEWEVREVDAATLRQIQAQTGQQQWSTRPDGRWPYQQQPQGQPMQYPQRQPQQPTGVGQEAPKAVFVSPSGQVYSLKQMNGVNVLVGPDGRWFPLNGNSLPGGQGNTVAPNHNTNSDDNDEPSDGSSNRHPPGPTEPDNKYGEEERGPSYDRGGGGPKGTRDAEDCTARSETTYNGGKAACRYQIIFEEHFEVLNLTLWKHDVLMPEEPDFEFVAYDKDPDNTYVDNSILFIKPTLLEDAYGPGFVMNGTLDLEGCTATAREQCSRTASTYRVLPPVRSARLTTRDSFTFKYGIVEMRVLVPEGDWIYPAITLEPATSMYGKWYAGGQIRLPYTVGNPFLGKRPNGQRTGLQVMRAGVALGKAPGADIQPILREKDVRAPNNSNWRKKHFRVYRVKWTPDHIEFSLDGKVIGEVRPPAEGFVSLTDSPSDHPWRLGTKMAPFDQEFFLSLGVGVGGVHRFQDGGVNGEYNEHPKPWKNSSPKAVLDFYKARDHWIPTWTHPALEIAHIKIWAL
ncbi:hypothetical protein ONE63_000777 [Megalurothrips usitatus]|uniref:GH16 domain-containing protein n=1 Tax=Megalurothrips usitatus TaxID=439358 RepID=A0AAV7Y3A2_9NEOP|nr:hypothetical protein ONE63_000777 [Megalurothrips usitatus]